MRSARILPALPRARILGRKWHKVLAVAHESMPWADLSRDSLVALRGGAAARGMRLSRLSW
eukprot:10766398-Alexandrium_andersonii.AAC.1